MRAAIVHVNAAHQSPARRRGIALVELALVVPFLLILVFGMVDFGRFLISRNKITNLSREAANLASRETPFLDTLHAIFAASGSLDLQQNGFVILTQVERDQNGNRVITKQASDGGEPHASHIGTLGGAPNLPGSTNLPQAGQILMVAEVFLKYEPVTPLGELIDDGMPRVLYDVAYFY